MKAMTATDPAFKSVWEEVHQKFERDWWANCANTLGEEMKQLTYARCMGLKFFHDGKSPYNIDMAAQSVIDIGGGPCSLMLRMHGLKRGVVVDPTPYPEWTRGRYEESGIEVFQMLAEDLVNDGWHHGFDVALIYNCLQHTLDPELIIKNTRRIAKVIRLFEWVDCGTSEGHPHELTKVKLDEWLGGDGKVDWVDENTARGKYYAGAFKGDL